MSHPHRTGQEPVRPPPLPVDMRPPDAAERPVQPAEPQPAPPVGVPRTRTGTAWAALIAATLLAVLLIVFLLQNTHSSEISFLWMSANTPVAVALLIAAVGAGLLTLILGTARIAQLRRQVRRRNATPQG